MQVALIGFGYWGQTLCKTLKTFDKPIVVFDTSKKALEEAHKQGFQIVDTLESILHSDKIKALVIAVTPSSHSEIVQKALEYDKHILVEKPFGSCLEDKTFLFHKAREKHKVLMIDYSFIYSSGFRKLKELLGGADIESYESLRMNSQFPVWNVALSEDMIIHDLSMLVELISSPPLYCSCQALEVNNSNSFQTALISITGSTWRAFMYVSRVFSEKKRLVLVKSSKQDIEFTEIDRQHYIKILDSKKEIVLTEKSSLEIMFEEFFNRIEGQSEGDDFMRYCKITSILKALNESSQKNGEKIKIEWKF